MSKVLNMHIYKTMDVRQTHLNDFQMKRYGTNIFALFISGVNNVKCM